MNKGILVSGLCLLLAACSNNYGKKVSNGKLEVYYKEGISEKEAQLTADLLSDELRKSNQDMKKQRSFQLLPGNGDTVLFRMVVDQQKAGSVNDEMFIPVAQLVSASVFHNKPVNMELTDSKLNPQHLIVWQEPAPENNTATENTDPSESNTNGMEKAHAGNVEVYAGDGMSLGICKNLAAYLNRIMEEPDHVISFRATQAFDDNAAVLFTVSMVTNPDKVNSLSQKDLTDMACGISKEVVNDAHVTFELTDDHFQPLRSAHCGGE